MAQHLEACGLGGGCTDTTPLWLWLVQAHTTAFTVEWNRLQKSCVCTEHTDVQITRGALLANEFWMFSFFAFFWDRVLCSWGWPWTCCVGADGLKLWNVMFLALEWWNYRRTFSSYNVNSKPLKARKTYWDREFNELNVRWVTVLCTSVIISTPLPNVFRLLLAHRNIPPTQD